MVERSFVVKNFRSMLGKKTMEAGTMLKPMLQHCRADSPDAEMDVAELANKTKIHL